MKLYSKFTLFLASVLILGLSACSSDPGTFLTYTQQKSKASGNFDPEKIPKRTDALALNYANRVEAMFRANATGARLTREGSDTTLAGLAAITGAAKSLAIGASGLSSMGMASGGIVALRTIFDTKGRATAYGEAAERIHAAIKDYGAYNLNTVSDEYLTPNGWTLANVAQANIDIVNKILNGHLPTPQALEQASEPMSPDGAKPQRTGATPRNNISGSGLTITAMLSRAPRAPETISKSEMERLVNERVIREAAKLKTIDFVADLRALARSSATDEEKKAAYREIVKKTNPVANVQPAPNDLNAYYQNKATSDETAALRKALQTQLEKLNNQFSMPPLPKN